MKTLRINFLAAALLLAAVSINQVKSFAQDSTSSEVTSDSLDNAPDCFEKMGYTYLGNDSTIPNGKKYADLSLKADAGLVYKSFIDRYRFNNQIANDRKWLKINRIVYDKKIVKQLKKSIKDVIKERYSDSRSLKICKYIEQNPEVLKVSDTWNGHEDEALQLIKDYMCFRKEQRDIEASYDSELKKMYENIKWNYEYLKEWWNLRIWYTYRRFDYDVLVYEKFSIDDWDYLKNHGVDIESYSFYKQVFDKTFETLMKAGVESLTLNTKNIEDYVVSGDNMVLISHRRPGGIHKDKFFQLKDGRWAVRIEGVDGYKDYCPSKCIIFNKKLKRKALYTYAKQEQNALTLYVGDLKYKLTKDMLVDMYGTFIEKKYANLELTPKSIQRLLYNVDEGEPYTDDKVYLYMLINSIAQGCGTYTRDVAIYVDINEPLDQRNADIACSLGELNKDGEMPTYDINDYSFVHGYDFTSGNKTQIIFGMPETSPLVSMAKNLVARDKKAFDAKLEKQDKEIEAYNKKIRIGMELYYFNKYYDVTYVKEGYNYIVAYYKGSYYHFYKNIWDVYVLGSISKRL